MNSPLLAAALAILAVGLVAAILLIPGLLPAQTASTGQPCAQGCSTPTPTATLASLPTGSGAIPTFVRPTPTPEPTFTAYTVQPGDSLDSIAHKFNTTGRSIAWWNRGTYPSLDPESPTYAPNNIQLGWVLVLIPGQKVDDTNPPTPSPGPPTDAPTTSPEPAASA